MASRVNANHGMTDKAGALSLRQEGPTKLELCRHEGDDLHSSPASRRKCSSNCRSASGSCSLTAVLTGRQRPSA